MTGRTRRKIEMGKRALLFSRAHPDASAGYAAALARLEDRLARAEQLAAQQREGLLQVRASTVRKRALRRVLKRTHLAHLMRVAEVAAREVPDLAQKFVLQLENNSYLAFRTAARRMLVEAEARRELLVRHGLVDAVLEGLIQALAELDAALEEGIAGRRAHVGASAELNVVADEVVQVVKVMDAHNRFRFANDPEALAAWASASTVVGPSRANGGPTLVVEGSDERASAEGAVRPAA